MIDPDHHFHTFMDLLDIERDAEKEENKRKLDRWPVEMREQLGKTVARLSIEHRDVGVGGLPLLILSRPSQGEMCIRDRFFPCQPPERQPCGSGMFSGKENGSGLPADFGGLASLVFPSCFHQTGQTGSHFPFQILLFRRGRFSGTSTSGSARSRERD